MFRKANKKGFTIVELIIIIAVIAVLAAVLIPTFSSIIKKSKISNDIQTATNLSTQVAIYKADNGIEKITKESELKNAICVQYGESFWNNLTPQSAKYGYHFWFNIDTQRVVLATTDGEDLGVNNVDANAQNLMSQLNDMLGFGAITVFAENEYKEVVGTNKLVDNVFRISAKQNDNSNNYYLLDKTGSDIANALTSIETLGDIFEDNSKTIDEQKATAQKQYNDAVGKIYSTNNQVLIEKLERTVVINEFGTFSKEELDATTSIEYYVDEIASIGGNTFKYNIEEVKKTVTTTEKVDHIIFDNTKEGNEEKVITIPSTVTKIEENGLIFAEKNEKTNVVINFGNKESQEISIILQDKSTNTDVKNEVEEKVVIKYNVSFETNGGEFASNPISEYTFGETITLPTDIEKTGYDFDGWYTNSDFTSDEYIKISKSMTGDKTFYAKWVAKEFTITINRANEEVEEIKFTIENKEEQLNSVALTKNDAQYTYSWKDELPTDLELKDYTFTETRVVNKYTISWDTDGDGTVDDTTNVEYGTVPTYADGTKAETDEYTYTFSGWNPTPVAVTGDATYTAQFTEKAKQVFDTKFVNYNTYTYRVGNKTYSYTNEYNQVVDVNVTLGKIFKAVEGVTIDSKNVTASYETISGGASATISCNTSDWTLGTIKFNNTGLITVTIREVGKPSFSIKLEVVDAVNVFRAIDATTYNVCLLDNCDIWYSKINISNGYYFYGNGFKITTSYNGERLGNLGLTEGYINLENYGVLDNVQLICAVYPKGYYYATSGDEYVKESSNESENSSPNGKAYKYQWSAISMKGNSVVSNCFVYGGRNNILIQGTATITNTVCEIASFANIQITATNSDTITLTNVTTSQYKVSDSFGAGAKVLGCGIVFGSGVSENMSSETNATLIINGLTQNNWVSENNDSNHSKFTPKIQAEVFKQTDFVHNVNGINYINTGIVYMNSMSNTVKPTISGYVLKSISFGFNTIYVYSVGKDVTGDVEEKHFINSYKSNIQCDSMPRFTCEVFEFVEEHKFNNGCYEYSYTHPEEIAFGQSIQFDVSKIKITRTGEELNYIVKDLNGNKVSGTISITSTTSFIVEIDNYSNKFKLTINVTVGDSPAPTIDTACSMDVVRLGSTSSNSFAVDMFTGMKVTYYSINSQSIVTKKLTDLVPVSSNKGKLNDTNKIIFEINNELKITVTSSGGFHSKENNYNGNPYYVSSKYYFAGVTKSLSSSSMNSGRTVSFSYVIEDYAGHTSANGTALKVTYSKTIQGTSGQYYGTTKFGEGELAQDGGGCFATGTLITMADGTQKAIENVKLGDKILAWDFLTGSYVEKNIAILVYHGTEEYSIAKLTFSNGTMLGIIAEHGLFDYDLNKFIYITSENCTDYIGHRFVKYEDNGYSLITLTNAIVTVEVTGAYSITSAETMNAFAEGILTVAPPQDFYNWITMGDKLRYDAEALALDIETYGLYTYDDFKDYVTYEQFIDWGGAYLKIPVEKGYFTFDYILQLIDMYKNWMK